LWAQALLPFEAPDELGATRVSVIRTILSDKSLQEMYLGIFGEPAIIQLLDDLPQSAGPFGTPAEKSAWTSLTHKTKSEVNIVFANIGKSIAAYERTITPQPGRFDKFVNSLVRADFSTAKKVLSENEMAGALLFVNSTKTNCLRCHNGPLLTNGGFHNIGTGKFTGSDMDFGRVFGVRVTLLDEFNCVGPYSDADPDDCSELRFLNIDEHVPLDGAFKVPTLRGLVRTAPYFHDGRHESIEDVLEHYRSPPDSGGANPHELNPLNLTELELEQLAAFLKTL
jgi:cytochrome c peroxidase